MNIATTFKKVGYLAYGWVKLLPFIRSVIGGKGGGGSDKALLQELFGVSSTDPMRSRTWWEKPGIGFMFQIEARPHWQWQRNYNRFNASMSTPNGKLLHDGPIPAMSDWVAFSKRIGCSYHTFEAKWHEGLCYWDSKHTQWKTPVDYCRTFADESQKAEIPYGFYYSSVFDHNPEFDDIQPLRTVTPSYIAMRGSKTALVAKSYAASYFTRFFVRSIRKKMAKAGFPYVEPYPWYDDFDFNDFAPDPERYIRYVLDQMDELCGEYGSQLMWMDWFDPGGGSAAEEIMSFMQEHYPNVALTFNMSANADLPWVHYVTSEAHGVKQTWEQALRFRTYDRHWELVTPAASFWDSPEPRRNPLENMLTAAITLAAGGKVNYGLASEMNGSFHPEVVKQMEALGKWYAPRRRLFIEATPIKNWGSETWGAESDDPEQLCILGSYYGDQVLLHVFNITGANRPAVIRLQGTGWHSVRAAYLEPEHQSIDMINSADGPQIRLNANKVDVVDTIIAFDLK